ALVGGDEIDIGPALDSILTREVRAFGRMGRPAKEVSVIVRAHKDVKTGEVQKVISMCQMHTFERFRLRVEEKE
ncbi:MAG: biopolymer transporter ExbD, partial [Planctomycetales bacterium]|nr:biopolymer transporter ExbD [Planctomycetales bacterium]NIP67917.1 biopolymer transporter ExbD [Planctomycetales bacterium]